MANHANRCLQVTCNFTHPSAQALNRVYAAMSFRYRFPNDDMSLAIQNHAKRMYADAMNIRGGWIGHIDVNTSIRNNMAPDTSLNDHYTVRA
ncbi:MULTISPECIES: hypothetical protein [unclassified Duganella]|uniref:hypothetical protein n=1 Tax=unclassified Duganella TaxID=2636909 RepID=UPI000A44A16E|nr:MULTISPECIES: hypothetical protein [unclassified Duganella]